MRKTNQNCLQTQALQRIENTKMLVALKYQHEFIKEKLTNNIKNSPENSYTNNDHGKNKHSCKYFSSYDWSYVTMDRKKPVRWRQRKLYQMNEQ